MFEIQIDGMIGPTHHFGGLGVGNRASEKHRGFISSPRKAALEGLLKMGRVAQLGTPQYFLPPLERPNWGWLQQLGFTGEPAEVLKGCWNEFPRVLSAAYSSAFMWTANAATVSCDTDTRDGYGYIMLANLAANIHREMEAKERHSQFEQMFQNIPSIKILPPLAPAWQLRDEGAANVMRLSRPNFRDAIYVFVWGADDNFDASDSKIETGHGIEDSHGTHMEPISFGTITTRKKRLPRQSRLASELLAAGLRLPKEHFVLVQQSRQAIDAGVFHNDVICMSHCNLIVYHEIAFEQNDSIMEEIRSKFQRRTGQQLQEIRISEHELSLEEAIRTYLFNSQFVTLPDGRWQLLCPEQCRDSEQSRSVLSRIQRSVKAIEDIQYIPLGESMANGGGPACLRLRVPISESNSSLLPSGTRITSASLDELCRLVEREYPERLELSDLADVSLAQHSTRITHEIRSIWRRK